MKTNLHKSESAPQSPPFFSRDAEANLIQASLWAPCPKLHDHSGARQATVRRA